LINEFKIERIFINGDDRSEEGYRKLLRMAGELGVEVNELQKGQVLDDLCEGINLRILNSYNPKKNVNDSSIISRLSYGKTSVLFMSDSQLNELVDQKDIMRKLMSTNVISVPHHGIPVEDNFSNAFVNKNFVISTGLNKWGKIDEEGIKKLKGKVYRTDIDGDIVFLSDSKEMWKKK